MGCLPILPISGFKPQNLTVKLPNFRTMKLATCLLLILCFSHILSGQTLAEYPAINTQLDEARSLQADFQFPEAIAAYEKVLHLLQGTTLNCIKYEVHRQVTFCLIDSERDHEAIEYINHALQDYDQGDCVDTVRLSRLYTALYDAYQSAGYMREARKALDQNHEIILAAFGEESPQMASLYYNYSSLYGQQGANYLALEKASQSLALRRKIYDHDEEDYFRGFYPVANYAERTGDYERAYLVLDSLIQHADKASQRIIADAYHLMSLVMIRKREYDVALKYADLSLEMYTQMYGPDSRSVSFAFQELGLAKTGLGAYKAAENDLRRAYDIRNKAYGSDHRLTLSSLTALIQAQMATSDTLMAIEDFKRTVDAFIKNYSIEHAEKYALHTITIGEMYESINLQDSALKYYHKVEKIADQHFQPGDRIFAQTHLALSKIGSYEEKMQHASQALFHLTGKEDIFKLSISDLTFSKNKYATLELYHTIAQNMILAYRSGGDSKILDQLLSLEGTFEMIKNEIFLGFLSPKSIIESTPLVRDICNWRLYAAQEKYRASRSEQALNYALRAMEQNKNILLKMKLFSREVRPMINLPDSVIRKEKQLYLDIKELDAAMVKTQNDSLRSLRLFLEKEYMDLRRQIKLASTRLLRIFTPDDLSIRKIRDNLHAGELLLNYFLQDTTLFILQIQKDDADLTTIKIPTTLQHDIHSLLDAIKDPHSTSNRDWIGKALALKKILLPFDIPNQTESLIIIPDNELYFLPFDILIEDQNTSEGYRDLAYLIKRYDISYLSSLASFIDQSSEKSTSQAFFYAPFVKNIPKELGLGRLPNASVERDALETQFDAISYLDEEATESTFRAAKMEGSIIHIASHAILDPDDPIHSKILLYPEKKNKSYSDGGLSLWELYQLNLNADLAILSACHGAGGAEMKGAGVQSLADGFYVAGTSSVVSNLWQLQDYAAGALISDFYQQLEASQNPGKALRHAKLKYLKEQNGSLVHPAFWAGWVYHGPARVYQHADLSSIWSFLGVIALLSILALVYSIWRKKS